MMLQIFEVIKAAEFFHDDCEFVFLIICQEVSLSTGEHIIESFKRNSKHSHIIDLEHSSKGRDHSLLNKDGELSWVCASRAVAQRPDCLVFYLDVVMLQNLYQFIDNAALDADLDLLDCSSGNIG